MVVCVGGGITINRLVGAAACCVCGLVSGRAAGGWCRGGTAGGGGGARPGVAPAGGPGVPLNRVGVACARRAVLAVPCWLRCRGADGRRPHGRLGGAVVREVMAGCRWMVVCGMGCPWGGCWRCWGAPTRPWCCWCWCAARRGSMGVYSGSSVVILCSGGGRWCCIACCWC